MEAITHPNIPLSIGKESELENLNRKNQSRMGSKYKLLFIKEIIKEE
jgi:hypothetical protein